MVNSGARTISDTTAKRAAFPGTDGATSKDELEDSAYEDQSTTVYEWYKKLPDRDRDAYESVYVLNSVILVGIAHLDKSKKTWEPSIAGIIGTTMADIELDLERFIRYCSKWNIRPRQLYERILDWSVELADRSRTGEALRFLERAEKLSVRSHPDLYARLVLRKARILFTTGWIQDAHTVLAGMAERYYLITDRKVIAEIFDLYGQTSLLIGEGRYLKNLLFRNLRHVFTSSSMRRLFTRLLIQKIYLRFFRALPDRELSFFDKVLFLAHVLDHAAHTSRAGRVSRLDRITGFIPGAVAYIVSTLMPRNRRTHRPTGGEGREARREAGHREAMLVTRAMGGVGDLLMMTPGLHALQEKYPEREIHLAVPRQFQQLFTGNADVSLLDIENDAIDVGSYARWYNFTDIPEAFVESRTLPNVKKNRIEIFARALGIRGRRLRKMDSRPRYAVTAEEKAFQRTFWHDRNLGGKTVLGVQLKSAEPYRDYPFMTALIWKLAAEFPVLLFHSEKTDIPTGGNVIDPGTRSLREAFALAAACDAIIAPDSAFVHLAGALNIPCVALYGPIDGRIRTTDYPSCTYLDARSVLQCVPCWRNENIRCKLTNMNSSACMGVLTVHEIIEKLKRILRERTGQHGIS